MHLLYTGDKSSSIAKLHNRKLLILKIAFVPLFLQLYLDLFIFLFLYQDVCNFYDVAHTVLLSQILYSSFQAKKLLSPIPDGECGALLLILLGIGREYMEWITMRCGSDISKVHIIQKYCLLNHVNLNWFDSKLFMLNLWFINF